MNPKPEGWKGGDEANSTWIGVTLGSGRTPNINTDPSETLDQHFNRNPVGLDWADNC